MLHVCLFLFSVQVLVCKSINLCVQCLSETLLSDVDLSFVQVRSTHKLCKQMSNRNNKFIIFLLSWMEYSGHSHSLASQTALSSVGHQIESGQRQRTEDVAGF